MKMTELMMAQLDAEAPRTRRALEQIPDGHFDWKPHEKSMPFGRLAMLVAQMPAWISLILDKDELDIKPTGGSNIDQAPLRTSHELVAAHEKAVAQARASLAKATDDQLKKPWRLLAGGKVMNESARDVVLRDTFMHLSHHRGQLTVYLRLNDAKVPAIYGPSADDLSFA
jgi:uncharacterized damage-inducible protein DinB